MEKQLDMFNCGLLIDYNNPFLAASSDGVVFRKNN